MTDEKATAVSTEQRALEKLEVTLKGMADNIEGMEERLKAEYGKDLTAIQEEQDEKRTKLEERLAEAIEKLEAPAVGDPEPDHFYGYGEDGLGDCINEIVAAGRQGGQPTERLRKMQAGELEKRQLNTLSGADGGWFMPETWSNELLRIPDDSQYLRSLCRTLPAGTPPNAEIKIRALDQTGSKGMYGGVNVYSAVEASNVTVTNTPKLKIVSLKPEKIGAYYQLTEELRANAATMAGLVGPLLQGAISAYIDDKIQTGTGAGEYLGFADNDAEIDVDRSVASEVNYIDLVNMLARILTRGKYVWLCQRVDMLPQLMTMTDGAGQLIWADSARSGAPAPTLLGIPIFYNEISPALGDAGDLRLVDLSYYLIKPGMGISIESDKTYGNFLAGLETIRANFYSDGKPWLTDALTLRDGTNTVSPFVSLSA